MLTDKSECYHNFYVTTFQTLAKHVKCRSSRPEVFCKKGVLRNFTKFTGKHLCQSLFFNKVAVIKKRLWHRCFPVNFMKFLRTPFFTEHLWWLLLYIIKPFRHCDGWSCHGAFFWKIVDKKKQLILL